MSKNKSKLRWYYVTEPFNVYVDPKQVKRIHAPIEKSLTFEPEYQDYCLHLCPCVKGVNEYGAVIKYLYCTRDGRFFVRGKDGWNEIIPSRSRTVKRDYKKAGGGNDCVWLQNFGAKTTHRCVAVAWCNTPKEALAEINNGHIKKKWEVDHLNTDHKNWTADNLQWVTPEENRRRGNIAKLLRRIVSNPKWLTPTQMRWLVTVPDFMVIICLNRFKRRCKADKSPLSIDAIRINLDKAIDDAKEESKKWKYIHRWKSVSWACKFIAKLRKKYNKNNPS